MRASYDPDLSVAETYTVSGDRYHHLVHVIRIETGEELLLLNGKGLKVLASVEGITKRELRLRFLSQETVTETLSMSLALGVPKKDALDLCLKEAVELGFEKLYLVKSDYSQTRVPEKDRLTNVLVSALEQSNSAFLPEVIECGWAEIPWDEFGTSLMLDSQSKKRQNNDQKRSDKMLLIVGPEGGFSPEELRALHDRPGMEVLTLPTPIMRTPTALAAGAGILLGRLLDR